MLIKGELRYIQILKDRGTCIDSRLDEIKEQLIRGDKFERMWKELTDCAYKYRNISNNYTHLVDFMKDIKQKHFPKDRKLVELERLLTELNNEVKKVLDGI